MKKDFESSFGEKWWEDDKYEYSRSNEDVPVAIAVIVWILGVVCCCVCCVGIPIWACMTDCGKKSKKNKNKSSGVSTPK